MVIHRVIEAVKKGVFGGFGGFLDSLIGEGRRLSGKLSKDVIHAAIIGLADADADSFERFAFEVRDDALHPVMAAARTTWTETDFALGNIHVVVDDDEVFQGDVIVVHQGTDEVARKVHEGLGLGEDDGLGEHRMLADGKDAFELLVVEVAIENLAEAIDDAIPHVVAGQFVFLARIS